MSSSRDRTDSDQQISIVRVCGKDVVSTQDRVAVEEPLEIRVVFGEPQHRTMRSVSVTMRTPGHDRELAAGFLYTESLLTSPNEIEAIHLRGVTSDGDPTGNIVRVDLHPEMAFDLQRVQRHFFTTSSCGVCGKASLEALAAQGLSPIGDVPLRVSPAIIQAVPERLRDRQLTFAHTGGLHAAGLFDQQGEILAVHEDVGRHNAVDKLIGEQFLARKTPLESLGMVISGRASFEIMQKALVARVPLVVAVGAPSSLAVDLATQYNMTLIGFASAKRFNVYSGPSRCV